MTPTEAQSLLKAEVVAESSPLLAAYTSSEVANDAKKAPRENSLDAPSIQSPTMIDVVKRAFKQFLGIPFAICIGAVVLAVVVSMLDKNPPDAVAWLRGWLTESLFATPEGTLGSLDMMAAGMFGLSTFTFSMLVIALQQSAGSTGVQVADGFINRKRNQTVLGFLLGVTIFLAMTRVLGDTEHNSALGGFLGLIFTLASVFTLAALFFMVTNQSRPNFIVDDLRARILRSRRRTHGYLLKTRRATALPDEDYREVLAVERGYISDIDFQTLRDLAAADPSGEIALVCELGDYMIHGDPIAQLRGLPALSDDDVRATVSQDSQRSLENDPTAGLTNLKAMSWRTGSAAQQNQETTVDAVNAMSDILVHWLHDEPRLNDGAEWNVVYPDTALFQLLDAIEQQLVVASASLQSGPVSQIYSIICRTMDWMTPEVQDRVADMVVRSLGTLSGHYLTLNLETALETLSEAFREHDRPRTSARIDKALAARRRSLAA